MSERKSVLDYTKYFKRGLPSAWALLLILSAFSLLLSIGSVAIVHKNLIYIDPLYMIVSGALVCIISVITPTMLTTFFAKLATRRMVSKHIFFMSFIGGMTFTVMLLVSSVVYFFFGPAISVIVIIVGAASIFGWWFFAERIISAKTRRSVLLALLQPTLFILFYIPLSGLIFNANTPINALFIKLYAGIFVFGLVIYAIMYVFNKPLKKSLGFNGIEFFSAIIQEWLFGINAYRPFNEDYGTPENIEVQAITFRNKGRKAVFFVPMVHYGIMGNIGGSNFPSAIEKYGNSKYKTSTFVMHTAVNEDFNPISANQVAKLKSAFDELVSNLGSSSGSMSYSYGSYNSSRVIELTFGGTSIVTFTRAPQVTEDMALESALVFRKLLEGKEKRNIILIDAHNSRYENAGAEQLDGIKINSRYMDEYLEAMRRMKTLHKSNRIRLGIGTAELYQRLNGPKDIARGNLNVALFKFNGFSYAMMQFNSNNILPSLRDKIVKHIKENYDVNAEVYTTDTHAVNSISLSYSNVLGRSTKFSDLKPIIDECMAQATRNIETVKASYSKTEMKKFMIWGRNSRERVFAVLNSLSSIVRVLVPTIIVMGFVAAAWVVSII